MDHSLTFQQLYSYDLRDTGITLPVELSSGKNKVTIPKAKLDTGASFCIFQQSYGRMLGLDIEKGWGQEISTPTGSFTAYGHEVSLSILGLQFDATVYFSSIETFKRNVLGRRGWLDRIQLGLIDYEGKLFISAYGEGSP